MVVFLAAFVFSTAHSTLDFALALVSSTQVFKPLGSEHLSASCRSSDRGCVAGFQEGGVAAQKAAEGRVVNATVVELQLGRGVQRPAGVAEEQLTVAAVGGVTLGFVWLSIWPKALKTR